MNKAIRSRLHVRGDQFEDTANRTVILRGVNLGGDCKVPYPDGGTNFPTNFHDHRDVSFIGRPFPIEDADEHLGRLAHWGFNCVRLLTTWEAVEHAGPGRYDEAYLDYFAQICRLAGEHGLYVFVDFHQDVWSRMTGGDGAPGWTLDAAGLDFTKFHAANAAHVMQYKYDYQRGGRQEDRYPQMSWVTNYRMAPNGIMWTLFFGGRLFTPDFKIEGVNVQDYLQQHYLNAMGEIARRVKDMPNVLGFDTLNEPGTGWFGQPLTERHTGPTPSNPTTPRPGPALSPLDNILAARGIAVSVPLLARNAQTSTVETAGETVVNPDGICLWKPGITCPFEAAGAYMLHNGEPDNCQEDFFRKRNGQSLTVSNDGFGPFFRDVAAKIRSYQKDWTVFAELDPYGAASGRPFPNDLPERAVNANHWYDAATLYLKAFDVNHSPDIATGKIAHGPDEVRARFIKQIGKRIAGAKSFANGAPSLIGEFGIPYDLNEGDAYQKWHHGERNVWHTHVQALELMYDALDALLLHSTQWNYTASNRNAAAIGDGWNQEDLSIFSRDQQDEPSDLDSGGRAIEGFCRPFAHAVQGRIERMRFQRESGEFELVFEADPAISAPTEIYVPKIQFPNGVNVHCEGADIALEETGGNQRLLVTAQKAGRITVTLQRND